MTKIYHKRGKKIDGYLARKHPNYMTWARLKSRCNNKNNKSYKNYGGRGIKVCERWLNSFENFCHDMGVRPSLKHSIDRYPNNDGNYEPKNCRWATATQQALNRRKFSNNTTGFTGIKRKGKRYTVDYHEYNKEYRLAGTFETPEEAVKARNKLIKNINDGKDVAHMFERKARFDSSTQARGIGKKGPYGHMVRATKNGERIYLGCFPTVKEAQKELELWKQKNNLN